MAAAEEIPPETAPRDRWSQGAIQQHAADAAPLPAAQVAHDLANFLTGMQMLVQSLVHVSPDQPAVRQHIASLQRTALHASELCDQLQKTLNGEKESTELGVCGLDVGALVSAMRRLLEVMVRPSAALDIKTAAGLPRIIANPTQLRQVVLDLVTNASDALESKNGSITIRTGVHKSREDRSIVGGAGPWPSTSSAEEPITSMNDSRDKYVFLEIADTGSGIAEDKLQRIFEPTFTTKEDGRGLGLASVLQIVRGGGGTVTVESRAGEGTRVRCVFPTAALKLTEHADPAASTDSTVTNGEKHAATILLVDDNDAVRCGSKLLLERCEQHDFSVLAAGTGREALRLLQQRRDKVSIIVLDLELPDYQGAVLLRQMRQVVPGSPILVVSGQPEAQLIAQCDGQKPEGLLVKPFDGDALIKEVDSILRSSRSEKPNSGR